jgi:signal transduction histidine kinase
MISRIIHGLAITLVIALVGGMFLIIRTTTQLISGLPVLAALVATAIVALAFLPLQESFERLANQFVRASQPTTAYHVLADLTTLSRATSADTSNLTGVAEAIAARLGARSCQLTVVNPGLRDRSYTWSAGNPPGADAPAGSDDTVELPIRQGTEEIGRIAVNRAAAASTQRRQLLEDIANSLGAIVAVNRLGIELERKRRAAVAHAEEIALARRQAVAEMDNERRRMERNLHDGAQHHLVSLRMTLGLVEHGITSGKLDTAAEGLGRLATQISSAEAVLAETATGVSSVLLTKRGLIAALNADLSGMHPPIVVTSSQALSGRRLPPEVETAVYFCCLEAVNNARKHASGATVSVRLAELDGALRFTVRDDGPGFVPESTNGEAVGPSSGRGMRNVRARITAVGGTISIRSAPGAGTTVEGAVPLPRRQNLLDQARELVREARQVYDGSAQSEQLRNFQIQLDRPLPAQTDGRAGAIRASAVLRALDAFLQSSPRGGDRAIRLRYQLEQIRSGTHELAEVELLEELRSGSLPLSAEERRVAEQLLGATDTDPRARLGLESDADTPELRQTAEQQRERWQRRASHPASTRAIRHAAEVLVLTCEQLLTRISSDTNPRSGDRLQ